MSTTENEDKKGINNRKGLDDDGDEVKVKEENTDECVHLKDDQPLKAEEGQGPDDDRGEASGTNNVVVWDGLVNHSGHRRLHGEEPEIDDNKEALYLKNRKKLIEEYGLKIKLTSDLEPLLKEHQMLYANIKPFKCSLCEYTSSENSNLARHMNTHDGLKPFGCSICDARFGQKSHLQSHMKRHTGEKPFKCCQCEYVCSQKSDLKKHIRGHTGEKPYTCTFCQLKFRQNSQLKRHVRMHTGEKPSVCPLCGDKFIENRCLQRHMKTHKQGEAVEASVSITKKAPSLDTYMPENS